MAFTLGSREAYRDHLRKADKLKMRLYLIAFAAALAFGCYYLVTANGPNPSPMLQAVLVLAGVALTGACIASMSHRFIKEAALEVHLSQNLSTRQQDVLMEHGRLLALHEISAVLGSSKDLEEALDVALQLLPTFTDATTLLLLLAPNGNQARVVAAKGPEVEAVAQVTLDRVSEGPASRLISFMKVLDQPAVVASLQDIDAERFAPLWESIPMLSRAASLIAVPIPGREKNLGMVVVSSPKPVQPNGAQLRAFTTFGRQIGSAVENARLAEVVARGKREWESTVDALYEGVFLVDNEGKLLRVNRAFARLVKRDFRSLVGQPCQNTLPQCPAVNGNCPLWNEDSLSGRSLFNVSIQEQEYEMCCVHARDASGEPLGLVHIVREAPVLPAIVPSALQSPGEAAPAEAASLAPAESPLAGVYQVADEDAFSFSLVHGESNDIAISKLHPQPNSKAHPYGEVSSLLSEVSGLLAGDGTAGGIEEGGLAMQPDPTGQTSSEAEEEPVAQDQVQDQIDIDATGSDEPDSSTAEAAPPEAGTLEPRWLDEMPVAGDLLAMADPPTDLAEPPAAVTEPPLAESPVDEGPCLQSDVPCPDMIPCLEVVSAQDDYAAQPLPAGEPAADEWQPEVEDLPAAAVEPPCWPDSLEEGELPLLTPESPESIDPAMADPGQSTSEPPYLEECLAATEITALAEAAPSCVALAVVYEAVEPVDWALVSPSHGVLAWDEFSIPTNHVPALAEEVQEPRGAARSLIIEPLVAAEALVAADSPPAVSGDEFMSAAEGGQDVDIVLAVDEDSSVAACDDYDDTVQEADAITDEGMAQPLGEGPADDGAAVEAVAEFDDVADLLPVGDLLPDADHPPVVPGPYALALLAPEVNRLAPGQDASPVECVPVSIATTVFPEEGEPAGENQSGIDFLAGGDEPDAGYGEPCLLPFVSEELLAMAELPIEDSSAEEAAPALGEAPQVQPELEPAREAEAAQEETMAPAASFPGTFLLKTWQEGEQFAFEASRCRPASGCWMLKGQASPLGEMDAGPESLQHAQEVLREALVDVSASVQKGAAPMLDSAASDQPHRDLKLWRFGESLVFEAVDDPGSGGSSIPLQIRGRADYVPAATGPEEGAGTPAPSD